jgi:hypothetical protein
VEVLVGSAGGVISTHTSESGSIGARKARGSVSTAIAGVSCRASGEIIEHVNFDVVESPAFVSEGLVNGGAETEVDIVSAVDLFIDVLVASSTAVSGPVVAIGAAGTERSQSSPAV